MLVLLLVFPPGDGVPAALEEQSHDVPLGDDLLVVSTSQEERN